jgi:hypothetical protein
MHIVEEQWKPFISKIQMNLESISSTTTAAYSGSAPYNTGADHAYFNTIPADLGSKNVCNNGPCTVKVPALQGDNVTYEQLWTDATEDETKKLNSWLLDYYAAAKALVTTASADANFMGALVTDWLYVTAIHEDQAGSGRISPNIYAPALRYLPVSAASNSITGYADETALRTKYDAIRGASGPDIAL